MIQISFGVDQYSINIVEIWPFLLKKKVWPVSPLQDTDKVISLHF